MPALEFTESKYKELKNGTVRCQHSGRLRSPGFFFSPRTQGFDNPQDSLLHEKFRNYLRVTWPHHSWQKLRRYHLTISPTYCPVPGNQEEILRSQLLPGKERTRLYVQHSDFSGPCLRHWLLFLQSNTLQPTIPLTPSSARSECVENKQTNKNPSSFSP